MQLLTRDTKEKRGRYFNRMARPLCGIRCTSTIGETMTHQTLLLVAGVIVIYVVAALSLVAGLLRTARAAAPGFRAEPGRATGALARVRAMLATRLTSGR
jgi:hypothetical protein